MKDKKLNNFILGAKIVIIIAFVFRSSYLFIPIFDMYCQTYGLGGVLNDTAIKFTTIVSKNTDYPVIRIDFHRDSNIKEFEFYPNLKNLTTHVDTSTLRFYTVHNNSNERITGIRTYNVRPRKFAQSFHKVECFCFDEMRINRGEKIELPILFYIDSKTLPSNLNSTINTISINYTFYKT
jgi:cytochrome c oxidase assembly protein subunit 11